MYGPKTFKMATLVVRRYRKTQKLCRLGLGPVLNSELYTDTSTCLLLSHYEDPRPRKIISQQMPEVTSGDRGIFYVLFSIISHYGENYQK